MGKSKKIDKRVVKMQKKAWKHIKNFCVDTPELKKKIQEAQTEEELSFVLLDNELMEVYFKLYDGLDMVNFFNAWCLYDYRKVEENFQTEIGEKLLKVDENIEEFEKSMKKIEFLSEKSYKDLSEKREKHQEMIQFLKSNIKRKINKLRLEVQVLEEISEKNRNRN